MASRKCPSLLSDKQIRRLVAKEKEKFYQEVARTLTEYKQSHDTDDGDSMQTDNNQGSAISSRNLKKARLDDIDDIEYRCLLEDLCKPDPDENVEVELKDIEHELAQKTVHDQEGIMNNSSSCEEKCDNYKFDFFDIMINALYDEDEVEESNCEQENEYLNFLMTSDKKDPKIVFMNEIRALCIKHIHTIPHVFINELLDKLRRQTGFPFPKDARTFLKTPRKTIVQKMDKGQYCHYGIKSALTTFLTAYKTEKIDTDCLKLIANIDGALLVYSSEDTSWIISISETILNLVEVVGIYDGEKKPEDSDDLVHVFVHELIDLINNGIEFEGKKYKVSLHCLVCDAPAKAYIMKTKLYSGYYSCSKCTIKGDYENKVFFPTRMQEGTTLRTDEKFINQEYAPNNAVFDEFQQGETIMKNIPNFRPITDVVLDYMHLVCLGIMLKLIELWIQNPKSELSEYQRKQISERLLRFKDYMPSDFSRNPRQFKNVRRLWKAHELRTFLLYTGPTALFGILPDDKYLNFLCLHVAITILVNPILCKSEVYLNYAEQLLISFVHSYEKCYKEINMVFNVHNILHLVNDVRRFGSLDNFSAFRFENHIRKVKQLIRKGDKRLQQIANRLMEIKAAEEYFDECDSQETNFSLIPEMEPFQVVVKNSFTIDCRNAKDRYVFLNNKMYVECHFFIKIDGQVYVEGRPLETVKDFYLHPLRSDILDINIVKPSSNKNSTQRFPYKNIVAKVCKLPLERIQKKSSDDESSDDESVGNQLVVNENIATEFVALPLIHTYKKF